MPITIDQGFRVLSQNLEITQLQATTASERQDRVREVIKQELTVLDTFLTGSYKRNTMIAPLSEADIDIFVVLDPSYFIQDGQASLLDKVKRALAKKYQTSEISRDGQAVTIKFTDFRVDVVPGFNRQGGGYLIPDTISKRWISTDPKKHVELWSQMNQKKNFDFVPLVKMLKGWNKQHSQLLQSFHLECLAYQSLEAVTISNFQSGVRFVFDRARNLINLGVSDPAGYGGNVGSYLNNQAKKDAVIQRLEAAYTKAIEAENFERQGNTFGAYSKWQVIFGNYFPAYGSP